MADMKGDCINGTLNSTLQSLSNDSGSDGSKSCVSAVQNLRKKIASQNLNLTKAAYSLVKNGFYVMPPEPPKRSRSYRDLILQEMCWMAIDYYHERRWKMHAARQISHAIVQKRIDRRRCKIDWAAKEYSEKVAIFWSNINLVNLSDELHTYCNKVAASAKPLEFANQDYDIEIQQQDLMTITVPVYCNKTGTEVISAKTDVANTVLDWMESMGTEYYRPIFRPPNEKCDCFTLPILDPASMSDFNMFFVLDYLIKVPPTTSGEDVVVPLPPLQISNAPQSTLMHPRRIIKDDDPMCLTFNLSDLLQTKNSPQMLPVPQKLTLKYNHPSELTSNYGFELLDDWMLSHPINWDLVATALGLRCSNGGLYPLEFSATAIKRGYFNLKCPPRGIFNSARKLLGPKQRSGIFSHVLKSSVMVRYRHVSRPLLNTNGNSFSGAKLPFALDRDIGEIPTNWCKALEPNKSLFSLSGYHLVQNPQGHVANSIAIPATVRQEIAIQTNVSTGSSVELIQKSRMPCRMSYTELSYRINKQLRIGFFGIPAKIFINSLFYSGRCCKDSRVKRVATTITAAPKYVSQQIHMLYSKMFEADLLKSQGPKMGNRAPRMMWGKRNEVGQDENVTELVQKYSREVTAHLGTHHPDDIVHVLASYVAIAIERGDARYHGFLEHDKQLLVTSACFQEPPKRKIATPPEVVQTPRRKSRGPYDYAPDVMMQMQDVSYRNWQMNQQMYQAAGPPPPQQQQMMRMPMYHPMQQMAMPQQQMYQAAGPPPPQQHPMGMQVPMQHQLQQMKMMRMQTPESWMHDDQMYQYHQYQQQQYYYRYQEPHHMQR
ncbi:Helicase-SANT-associated domain [Babesia duncani]|uniref:Helicase-SANT-associated domain n=1 Tax=Babesia duncani TaxID=323732 RepID=A0AAD9PIN7_9APIC|nr:Helicase-SANT-associated domain [Babesia duncani]